jgi:DNA repair protein RadA/Sms
VARAQSRYVCQACGAEFLRWEGQCRACDAWNTLVETVVTTAPRARRGAPGPTAAVSPVPLADVGEGPLPRISTGLTELDRVLGGGIVPGSLVLIGGEPGVGKSTLLLQVAGGVASGERGVLYATGEESGAQVRLRAARLGLLSGAAGAGVGVLATSEVGAIVEATRAAEAALVVVDSIQTMTVEELDGPAGSVGQVRESALRLMELAKADGPAVILVGHVTKDGSIAGPRTLEHLVDAVIELGGDRGGVLRILRSTKNRFGSTDEIGVFEMRESGLAEVADPGRAFLADRPEAEPGSVVAATMEGTRPLLVEVQALVTAAGYGTPARRASGVDPNRLALLLAVLGRRAGVALGTHDVYANLAGGLSVTEPGLDLAIALALASSLRDRPVTADTVAVGEVGLLGELRPTGGLERRLREAARLGFSRAIVPAGRSGRPPDVEGLEIIAVETLRAAIEAALGRHAAADASIRSRGPTASTAGARVVG